MTGIQTKFFQSTALAALLSCAMAGAQAAPVDGQGTWQTTLQARDLDGNTSSGPEAWFDTALNITWLADANFASTIGYSSTAHGPEGRMVFGEALLFTGNLSIGGVTGWRLPTLSIGDDASTSDSELAHLFSVTLGNVDALGNTGPFANIASTSNFYWTNDRNTFKVALFNASAGWIDAENAQRDRPALAWAVLDGDVASAILTNPSVGNPSAPAPIPEAGTVGMALAGLAVTALALRRRQRTA